MKKVCYRVLRRYKFQVMKNYKQHLEIEGFAVDTPYLRLGKNGELVVKKGYAWDGPSGPTVDTMDFMRGSLVHDALYQLIRMEEIPYTYREYADKLLKNICREDGMSKIRSWYVYQAVKRFGGASAEPGSEKPAKIICAPG